MREEQGGEGKNLTRLKSALCYPLIDLHLPSFSLPRMLTVFRSCSDDSLPFRCDQQWVPVWEESDLNRHETGCPSSQVFNPKLLLPFPFIQYSISLVHALLFINEIIQLCLQSCDPSFALGRCHSFHALHVYKCLILQSRRGPKFPRQ